MDFKVIPETERIILDLVLFENILITYNREEKVTVEFTLDPAMHASTRDWVGIYHAGWDSYESFLAYEWGIGQPINNSCRTRKLVFEPKSLVNARSDKNYQFVYINQHLEIMGVSQFFQFVTYGFDDVNLSDFSKSNFFHPTHYLQKPMKHENPTQKIKQPPKNFITNAPPPSPPLAVPSCNINLPSDLEKVYTVCSKCKQLFELIEQQSQLKEKLDSCAESNEELQDRVMKLEEALENMKLSNASLKGWNEDLERQQLQNFFEEICKKNFNEGHGDNRDCVVKNPNIIEPNNSLIDDFNNREIFLKAIIGNQEIKIRELTKVICQSRILEQPMIYQALPAIVEDVVTVIHTEETLLPEECEIINNHVIPNSLTEEEVIDEINN